MTSRRRKRRRETCTILLSRRNSLPMQRTQNENKLHKTKTQNRSQTKIHKQILRSLITTTISEQMKSISLLSAQNAGPRQRLIPRGAWGTIRKRRAQRARARETTRTRTKDMEKGSGPKARAKEQAKAENDCSMPGLAKMAAIFHVATSERIGQHSPLCEDTSATHLVADCIAVLF